MSNEAGYLDVVGGQGRLDNSAWDPLSYPPLGTTTSYFDNMFYDAAGNRLRETATGQAYGSTPVTTEYQYDNLNELKSETATYPAGNGGTAQLYQNIFNYDVVGNPKSFRRNTDNSFNKDNQSTTYNPISYHGGTASQSFSYNGNESPADGDSIFDPENRLVSKSISMYFGCGESRRGWRKASVCRTPAHQRSRWYP